MAALGTRLEKIYPRGVPGVFLQGLLVFGMHGEVVYENQCADTLSSMVVQIAREFGLSLIAYSRDCILCEKRDPAIDLLPSYHVRYTRKDCMGCVSKHGLTK